MQNHQWPWACDHLRGETVFRLGRQVDGACHHAHQQHREIVLHPKGCILPRDRPALLDHLDNRNGIITTRLDKHLGLSLQYEPRLETSTMLTITQGIAITNTHPRGGPTTYLTSMKHQTRDLEDPSTSTCAPARCLGCLSRVLPGLLN